MDHMRRKTVKFDNINMVILDEADEMLDMGFREDMETILTETPEDRQTVMFSATMPKAIMDIARNFQKDARIIKVVRKELTVSNIEQFYYEVRPKNKTEVLCRLIVVTDPMLATGGSAVDAIDQIKKHGGKKIKFMCIIAAPEGLEKLHKAHPDVQIYVGHLDRQLNEQAYICPGLGDAGDRIFGTK